MVNQRGKRAGRWARQAIIGADRPSGKVRHDIRGEKFSARYVVPSIGVDQQVDSGVLVLPDEVDGFGRGADKTAQRSTDSQSLALCRQSCIVAGK